MWLVSILTTDKKSKEKAYKLAKKYSHLLHCQPAFSRSSHNQVKVHTHVAYVRPVGYVRIGLSGNAAGKGRKNYDVKREKMK